MNFMRFLVLLMAAAPFLATAQWTSDDKWMVYGERAYRVFPPVCAAQGAVGSLMWSPDGRYLAIMRMSMDGLAQVYRDEIANPGSQKTLPPMTVVLEIYHPATGRTISGGRWESKTPGEPPPAVGMEWMAGTSYLFVTVRQRSVNLLSPSGRTPGAPSQNTLERIDAGTGQRSVLMSAPDGDSITLGLSPTQPMGLAYYRQGEQLFGVLLQQNRVSDPVPLEGLGRATPGYPMWSKDGKRLGLASYVVSGNVYNEPRFHEVDLATLALREVPRFEPYEPPMLPIQGGVQSIDLSDRMGTAAKTAAAMIHGPMPQILPGLAPDQQPKAPENFTPAVMGFDAGTIAVDPTGRFVAYTSQGLALVSELVPVPLAIYEQAKAARERSEKLMQAKQVATGFLIYSADNDDNLPSNRADWQTLIAPYLRNNKLLEGFVYSFKGGSLMDVEKPSQTELGFISMPGGRIVAYVDTSVRWVPDVP